ncbi:MAG: bifunctional nuclease family protein, partial [Solirubrobacterales bacterium]
LDQTDTTCERIASTALRDNPYSASITISVSGTEIEVDSRPSDALALAVRLAVPIFVADEVIEESSIEFEQGEEDTDEVVEQFKDFLEDVSPEDFLKDS